MTGLSSPYCRVTALLLAGLVLSLGIPSIGAQEGAPPEGEAPTRDVAVWVTWASDPDVRVEIDPDAEMSGEVASPPTAEWPRRLAVYERLRLPDGTRARIVVTTPQGAATAVLAGPTTQAVERIAERIGMMLARAEGESPMIGAAFTDYLALAGTTPRDLAHVHDLLAEAADLEALPSEGSRGVFPSGRVLDSRPTLIWAPATVAETVIGYRLQLTLTPMVPPSPVPSAAEDEDPSEPNGEADTGEGESAEVVEPPPRVTVGPVDPWAAWPADWPALEPGVTAAVTVTPLLQETGEEMTFGTSRITTFCLPVDEGTVADAREALAAIEVAGAAGGDPTGAFLRAAWSLTEGYGSAALSALARVVADLPASQRPPGLDPLIAAIARGRLLLTDGTLASVRRYAATVE